MLQKNITIRQEIEVYNHQFLGLAGTMEWAEYRATIVMYGFMLESHTTHFTIKLLKELLSSYPLLDINGQLTAVSFEQAQEKINFGLLWRGSSCDYDAIEYPQARAQIFWDIVQRAISFPIEQCFEYRQTDSQCIFGGSDWVMWEYCFILIKKNIGVVIACGAGPD